MIAALPLAPAGRTEPSEETARLCRGCRAQGARGAELAGRVKGRLAEFKAHAAWLYGGMDWNRVAASCPAWKLARLAAMLGLDPRDPDRRKLFLTALTTLSTREWAWRIVLELATEDERTRLLEIRAIDDGLNEANGKEISAAGWLCRGLSTDEFEGVCGGTVGSGELYGIFSMTTIPEVALEFALRNLRKYRVPHVIVVLDASLARSLGARPAFYSLASDALDLDPQDERGDRAFKARYADEAQAQFDLVWPTGSSRAVRAVAAVGDPSPHDLWRLERTGIPVVALEDLLYGLYIPHREGAP